MLLLLFLFAGPASAYTFLVVDSTATGPAPFRWDPAKPVDYLVDRGDLSPSFKNADGVRLIQSAFDRWQNGMWSGQRIIGLNVQYKGLTGVDITKDNFRQFEGETVIIFDVDGSILNALLGSGASGEVLGLGEVTDTDDLKGFFISGRATLNGSTIGKPGLGDFEGTVVHELGHFLGLGHTYVAHELVKNGDPSDDGPVPTMYPTALEDDTQMRTPEIDDFAGLGALYGTPAFQQLLGKFAGTASWTEGLPVLGAHVEVRNLSDPGLRVGAITGYLGDGTGGYLMMGAPPGDYKVTLEAIPFSPFQGASAVGPYDPPMRDLFPTVIYKAPSEPSSFTRVPVSAGQTATVSFSVAPEALPAGLAATRFPRLSPVHLEDDATTTDSVKVSQTLQVKGLSVFVDIAHQYIGDLKISLSSPSGLSVILVAYAGFSGNLIETTFTQQKVPGLSRFVGENAAGTWTLTVVDSAPEDVGTLRRWWVTILSASGTTALRSDFNGDGKVDFDDFFLFADAFGRKQGEPGYDSKFDLDGGGTVDFNDFFTFADDFGKKL